MLIHQNSPDIQIKQIRDIGCFFRSCLWVAENYTGKYFDGHDIDFLWIDAQLEGYLDDDNNLKKAANLIQLALSRLDVNTKVYEIGTFENGKIEYYKWVKKNPKFQRNDAFIQKIKTPVVDTHFRVVDYKGDLLFDPWKPAQEVVSIYYSIIFYIKG